MKNNIPTELLAEILSELSPSGPLLLMGDAAFPSVPQAAAHWRRRGENGMPWPPVGPYGTIALRLPKGRDELAYTLDAAATVLVPGGLLLLAGANDEGIRSAGKALEPLFTQIETIAVKRHCRVLAARRRNDLTGLRGGLAAWRQEIAVPVNGAPRSWVTYPGLFAGGALDPGTALLLAHAPVPDAGSHILDYGCGSGIIAATLKTRQPALTLDLLDIDSLALLAAAENVPQARRMLGSGLAACGDTKYDFIISNPPFHTGTADDLGPLRRLITAAPASLHPKGKLVMVVQRRIALKELLGAVFKRVEVVVEDKAYRVWLAENAKI